MRPEGSDRSLPRVLLDVVAVAALAGLPNAYAEAADRYPKADPAGIEASGAELVLLPDEPYVFTADDGPEAFTRTPTELLSGRLITWYGPSLLEARKL